MGHMLGGQEEGQQPALPLENERNAHFQTWLEKAQMEGAHKI
jgi:hypothetical protein